MSYATIASPDCACGAPHAEHGGKAHTGGYPPNQCRSYHASRVHADELRRAASRQARDHLVRILSIPGVTYRIVTQLSGLSPHTVVNVTQKTREWMSVTTHEAIMSITVRSTIDALEALEAARNASCRAVQVARSLCAQGWNYDWQADRYHTSADAVERLCAGDTSTLDEDMLELINETAEWVEAGPRRRGESIWGPDLKCALSSLDREWRPLACYDEDGIYVTGSDRSDLKRLAIEEITKGAAAYRPAPGEYSLRTLRRAEQRIEVLRRSLFEHMGADKVADVVGGITSRSVDRWRDEAGLRFVTRGTNEVFVAAGYEDRAREIRAAIARYDAAPIDPVGTVQALGMMRGIKSRPHHAGQGSLAA